MSITTYNANYHDDYTASQNGDKNYLRILFKPGYSVQVRELNQLQSALQDQINRLGSSVWKDDTAVIGGKTSFLPSVRSLRLNLSTRTASSVVSSLYGAAVREGFVGSESDWIATNTKTVEYISGVRGEVLGYKKINASEYVFYFTYVNTGTSDETEFESVITTGYRIILRSSDLSLQENELPTVSTLTYVATGFASGLVCEEGVFFTKGSFVAVPRQTVFIDKETEETLLSGYAVLKIDENIITYSSDTTLLDNANGTPNYSAPGADRYSIDLTLEWITSTAYSIDNLNSYIKLLVINSSRPVEIVETAEYSEIIDILAKRTSEESGNYTVNPFSIQIRETFDGDNLPADCIVVGRRYRIQDLGSSVSPLTNWVALGATSPAAVGSEFVAVLPPGDGSNNTADTRGGGRVSEVAYIHGAYKADDLDQIGYTFETVAQQKAAIEDARGKFTVTLDPSVAYVDGYRVALDKSLNLTAPKALETGEFNVNVSANIGNYFIGNIQKANNSESTLPSISSVTNIYNLYAYSNGAPANSTSGGVIIGTCRIKAFEATGGSSTQFKCYVYDVTFNSTPQTADWNARRFDNIDQIVGNNFMFNVTSGNLLETTSNVNLFELPYPQTKTLQNISYYVQHTFSGSAAPSIALNVGDNKIFTDTSDITLIVNGDIKIQGTHYTATLSSNVKTITIVPISSNWSSGALYSVIAKVKVLNASTAARVTKSVATTTDSGLTPASGGASRIYTLKNTDIIRIVSVVSGGKDITASFKLIDNGQRDNIYTNGRVQYVGAGALNANIDIEYEYYERVGGISGRDLVMYTVDSYSSNNNSVGTPYDNIPTYSGIKLSDVIDFRQDVIYTVNAGVVGNIVQNTGKSVIDPNTPITCAITCYLPRIDKVTVNSRNEFAIVQGIPALTPVEPGVPKNSMTLYTLNIPAYTPNVSEIVKNYIDNRRYTMRDIGALEKRIGNIEYYTSLSLLERSANDKSIFDEAGERFKNGILVDNFIGHGVGDVFDPQYQCSVDRDAGLLRPRYNSHNIDLAIDSPLSTTTVTNTTSGTITRTTLADNGKIRVHDSIITLSYDEVELVSHLKATAHISVHPHIYAKINGNIRLSPAADNWKDTVTRPDLIVTDNSAFDAIKFIAEDPTLDILGTDWNNWTREWGASSTTTTRGTFIAGRGIPTTTTTSRAYTDTRTGTNTTLGFSFVPKSLGESVVDTAIIPFIRSRIVYFHATGLKASTRVYPFFEDRDISAYTNQILNNDASKFIIPTTVNDNTTRRFDGILPNNLPSPETGYSAYGSALTTDTSGELYGSFIIPNNTSVRFRTGDRTFKLTDDPRNLSSETTYALAKYTASGILETVQETILSTKTPQFTVTPISDTRSGTVVTSTTTYHDPLAQSFVISPEDYPTGVFITSVDIYFAQKALFQPVEIYIVTMENGAPTRTIVPYSRTFRRPSEVQISADGSLPTNFRFSDPVFLKSDEEYAVIVSSNDGDYRCWYAILGESDVITGKRIEKQEYLGTFFTSANAFTWTPQQEQDLKFKINRARFFDPATTTIKTGNINFRTQLHTGVDTIEIVDGGSGYGLPPTITFNPNNGTRAEAIIDPFTGSISRIIIHDRGAGYNNNAPAVIVTKNIADSNTPVAPNLVAKLAEIPVSIFNLRQPNLAFNNSAISHSIQFGTESPVRVEANSDNYIPSSYGNLSSHILTSRNQTVPFGPRAIVTSNLITADPAISPIIDVDGSSLLTIDNIINDDSTDEAYTEYESNTSTGGSVSTLVRSSAGWTNNQWAGKQLNITSGSNSGQSYRIVSNTSTTLTFSPNASAAIVSGVTYKIVSNTQNGEAQARYITRKVTLNTPSDWLNVYLSTNRPTFETNIKVYVKLGFDTTTPDDQIPWTELTPTNPIPINANPNIYSETEYKIDPNDDFISFQVKVVLLSNNIFDIPTVRDFRAIATV
jgi:hypothetical protein